MNEAFKTRELDIQEFMKPKCPVSVGDRFYRNYHVPSGLNTIVVEKIEEANDEEGPYYIITGRSINMAVGINVQKYSSRLIGSEQYTILKKGRDF